MINLFNKRMLRSGRSSMGLYLLLGGILAFFAGTNTAKADVCPEFGPQKRVASSFHSTAIIDSANTVRYWGDGVDQTGSGANVPFPLTLTGYTGTPVALAASSVGANAQHQHFLLTTTNLYGWAYSANTIVNGTAGNTALTTIALPAGVTAATASFIEASNGGLALVTTAGEVWIKAGTGSLCSPDVYGDGSTALDVAWHHVTTAPGVFLTGVTRLSFGGTAVMAMTLSGQVYIWGTRTYLGDGSAMVNTRNRATLIPLASALPGVTPADVNVINYSSGTTFNASEYILSTNKNLYAVGYNNAGQLGQGNTTNLLAWTAVKDSNGTGMLSNIIQLTSNNPYSFNVYSFGVLTSDNTIFLWGANDQNMAGSTGGAISLPRIPDNFNVSHAKVSYLKMGGHTTLTFLKGTNKFCYIGHKIRGSMGEGTIPGSPVPSFDCYNTPEEYICPAPNKFCVTPSSNDLVATANHAVVLINDFPSFTYWGEKTSSYLTPGLNELSPQSLFEWNGIPRGVAAGSIGTTLEASNSQMWALTTEGLWGWGYSANTVTNATLGNVVNTFVALPTGILPSQVSFIRASRGGVAIVTTTGEVWIKAGAGSSCSANVYGDGTATLNSNWHQVTTAAPGNPALTGVTELSFAGTAAMAITPAGVYVWGVNTLLGDGTAASTKNRATLIPAIAGVTAKSVEIVQAGALNAAQFILGTNGKVYAVGENKDGVLGQNNIISTTSWVNVKNASGTGTLVSVSKLSTNNAYAFDSYSIGALTIDGTLYLWGDNNTSRLGGAAARYLLPQTPATILPSTVSNFDIGGHFTMVFKKSSSVFCFVGHQVNGSLGDGTTSTATISTPNCATTPVIPQCAGVAYTISGKVYNDANGIHDGLVNGTLVSSLNGSQLYANLLDDAGYVVASVPVSGGNYAFNDFPTGTYTVSISTTAGTVGNLAPALGLSGGWVPSGDQLGTTPNVGLDAVADGALTITVTNSNINNVNFGFVIPKPVAVNDTTTTLEDTPKTFSLVNNDWSPINNLDTTSIVLLSVPPASQGTVVVHADGTITFTPASNFNGIVTPFDYKICTIAGLCDTATIYITVTPVNDPPVITDTTVTTPEDTPITVCKSFTDVDAGDTHTTTIACGPTNGTITNGPTVTGNTVCLTYSPNTNYNGTDSICVVVCDNGGLCDTGVIQIGITHVNHPPVISDTSVTTLEDTPITVCKSFSDIDAGDTHTTTIACGPTNGTITSGPTVVGNTVCLTYTPNANYNGTDSICVVVCDNGGLCDTGVIHVNITPVNDPPVITDTTVVTPEDTPITVCKSFTDVDAGDTHTTTIACGPTNGTITSGPTVTGNTVCLTYSPNTNYNGTDSICVVVCDNGGLCDTGVIHVNITPVNDAPIANMDEATTNEDTPVTIPILSNDTDVDGGIDPSSVTITEPPKHGSVVVNADGSITYSPNADYNGQDTLVYQVCDLGTPLPALCDTAIVYITINAVNDAPEIGDTTVTTPEDTLITVCLPFSDVDAGDTHTTTIACGPMNGTITSGPSIGNNTICLTYSPNANYNGTDSICVVVCDNGGLCDTGVIHVNITPVNDAPEIADTTVTTPEDTPITVCLPFSDVDAGDTHTTTIACGPMNGTITSGPSIGNNTICLTYSPNANYNGTDSICVVVCDNGGLCDTGVIHVNITPVSDTIRHTVPGHINDTICDYIHPEGEHVVVKNCDGSTMGTTVLGGTWSIDPATKCLVYKAGANKGNDTLCIIACDTIKQYCNTTTVIVTVTGYPPIAVNDTSKTTPNTPVTIPVLSNDTTRDQDPLVLDPNSAVVIRPGHGTVVVNHDGTITYTPVTGYTGIDSFQYQICDPDGCDSAWVFITIEGCVIPNAFSPNGDGINDHFEIPCAEGNVSFSVWNRWGIEIYRNDRYLNDWDGTYKGSPLPDGTYYYVLRYTKSNGEEVNKAGFITLHR